MQVPVRRMEISCLYRSLLVATVLLLHSSIAIAQVRYAANARDCLSLAMYWEARGEGVRGMQAVGSVILNRVADAGFPSTVCGVIFQGGETPPCQFSWWCDGRSDRPRDGQSWRTARTVAGELIKGRRRDPTKGSLFFHSTGIRSEWHQTRQRTVRIGKHVFYR